MCKTIKIRASRHRSAGEALQAADAEGWETAIYVAGMYLTTTRAEAERLAAAGASFAYLYDHVLPDGSQRIVTVPVH